MQLDQAIKIVEQYNNWRRGKERYDMPDPKAIGIAIDIVINHYKNEKKKKYID